MRWNKYLWQMERFVVLIRTQKGALQIKRYLAVFKNTETQQIFFVCNNFLSSKNLHNKI